MQPIVIDIYQGNDIEDMSLLRNAGIKGIIHKATQGISVHDGRYAARRKWAKDSGIDLWGAYHFNSETSSIKQQAVEFIKAAQPDDYTLLAMDWEGETEAAAFSAREARDFLNYVMDLTHRTPAGLWIYGGNIPRQVIQSSSDMDFFGQFHNWHCQYGSYANVSKAWPNGYDLWQYSEHGQLAGTGSEIDLNVAKGSFEELRAKWAPGYAAGHVALPPPKTAPGGPAADAGPKPADTNHHSFWDWFIHH